MTALLTHLETAKLALHNARLYMRQEPQIGQPLLDAGWQAVAQIAAFEGRPRPAIALMAALAARRDYDALLDSWQHSDGDQLARMDTDSFGTRH